MLTNWLAQPPLHPLCPLFCSVLPSNAPFTQSFVVTFPMSLLLIYFCLANLWVCSANVLTPIGKTSSWCHHCHLAQTPKTSLVWKEMSTERFWFAPLADYTGLTKHLTHLDIESELLHCLSRETSSGPPQSHFHLRGSRIL